MTAAPKYQFTADHFSRCIPYWEQLLRPYRGKPNLSFLEIGCCEGRATIWLLENILTHKDSTIDCVDIFTNPGIEQRFDGNIRAGDFQNKTKKIKGGSQIELRKLLLNHYDFVYIDGSHFARAVLEDLILAFRLLKVGGIMVIDDYEWRPWLPKLERPKIAIDAFLDIYRGAYELILKDYQAAIKRTEKDPLTYHKDAFYMTGA